MGSLYPYRSRPRALIPCRGSTAITKHAKAYRCRLDTTHTHLG